MMIVLLSLMLSFFVPAAATAQQDSPAGEQIVEGIAAIITISSTRKPIRELIFYSDLERHRQFFETPEAKYDSAQRLDQVIQQRLLRPEARRFILQAPTADAIQERLGKIRKRFANGAPFEEVLRQTGLLEDELKTEISEYLWVEQLLNERIKGFVFISPKAVEAYFEAHPDFFADRALAEVHQQIEAFLITEKEAAKKTEYLQRIKAKAEIKILLKLPKARVKTPG